MNSSWTPIPFESSSSIRKATEEKARGQEFQIDLGLYIRVLRRHRLLVATGCALALALALLSYVRVSDGGLTYRTPEIWSNEATLALSTPEGPEWRSELPSESQLQPLAALVDQYAAYATSDPVIRSLRKRGFLPRRGASSGRPAAITASAVASPLNGQPTPLLTITGTSTSAAAATRLTMGATDAFINYARSRQNTLKIPLSKRVELSIVKRAGAPTLTAPRSKTKLIIILLAGLTATVAAAFVRDNMQRARSRQSQNEPVAVLDPLREAEPPLLNGSEPVHGAAENPSRSGRDEAGDGSEVQTFTRTRRSARSSR